ncbi:hypothetical protein [Streptomyces carpaticus]|uniref:Uncharacterized protein n=1 Tax=Streptomyces carpaticus TaxID=285558 RepID=A0ABV4ZN15_9ACTN
MAQAPAQLRIETPPDEALTKLLRDRKVTPRHVFDATGERGLHDKDPWEFMKAVTGAYFSTYNFTDLIARWNPERISSEHRATVESLLKLRWTLRHYTKSRKPEYRRIVPAFDVVRRGNSLESAATAGEGSTHPFDWAALGNVKFTFFLLAVNGIPAYGNLVGHSQKLGDVYPYYAEWPMGSADFHDCWMSLDLKDLVNHEYPPEMNTVYLKPPYPACRGTGKEIVTAMALYLAENKLPANATAQQVIEKINRLEPGCFWEVKNAHSPVVDAWRPTETGT